MEGVAYSQLERLGAMFGSETAPSGELAVSSDHRERNPPGSTNVVTFRPSQRRKLNLSKFHHWAGSFQEVR